MTSRISGELSTRAETSRLASSAMLPRSCFSGSDKRSPRYPNQRRSPSLRSQSTIPGAWRWNLFRRKPARPVSPSGTRSTSPEVTPISPRCGWRARGLASTARPLRTCINGFATFPRPNVARRKQIFEIWIRPVVPTNAHAALRIALYELQKLIDRGLTPEQFVTTRDYLMKNVYLMTATEDEQNGYALDSKFYGIGEFTQYMRDKLSKLTVDDVNRAIRRHLSAKNLSVVIVTKDATGLKDKLLSDAASPLSYDAPKPSEVLEEDKIISAMKLNIKPENLRVTPVDEVFARDSGSELASHE